MQYVSDTSPGTTKFFGKFFDAGGAEFEPFGSKNKYIVIKEEKQS